MHDSFSATQHRDTPALRVTAGNGWSVIDLLEPLLLLVTGAVLLQLDRFAPSTLLFALALLLVPYLLRWIFYGAPGVNTLALLPLAILLLLLLPITTQVTPDFWGATWPELVRLLWGGAVFLGVINWALPQAGRLFPERNAAQRGALPTRFGWLTAAYLLLGIGLALLGLLNMALVNKIPFINPIATLLLPHDVSQLPVDDSFNPNRVAAVLILICPLPLAWLIAWHTTPVHPHHEARRRAQPWAVFWDDLLGLLGRFVGKVGWLALWLGLVGALVLTQSRTALLATAVATLLILLLTLVQPTGGLRLLGTLCLFALLVGMGYFSVRLLLGDLLLANAGGYDQAAQRLVDTRTLTGRVVIWQRALYGIADHPLTGYGLGAFGAIAQQPYPLPGYVPGAFNHAHNLFLQTALDLGLPGLITFATLVGLAGLGLFTCYRSVPPHTPQATWALGMMGTFAGFLVYNLFDGLTLGARPAVVMWFFLGLAIAAGQRQVQWAVLTARPLRAGSSADGVGG